MNAFQGRYKALLVEPDATGAVCHYIHLNPVRAKVRSIATLGDWPWTSLGMLLKPRERPAWYSPAAALLHAGGLDDTPAGRKRYRDYLGWLQEDEAGKKALEFERLSKGWAVGARGFKKDLLKEHRYLERTAKRGEAGAREISAEMWQDRLMIYLAAVKKTSREIENDAMGAPWKVAVASAMKATTTATNPWLAARLRMGSPFRLSRLVSACRSDAGACGPFVEAIAKCKV